jgi:hypothetical protein
MSANSAVSKPNDYHAIMVRLFLRALASLKQDISVRPLDSQHVCIRDILE